jgi:hypothetical protein
VSLEWLNGNDSTEVGVFSKRERGGRFAGGQSKSHPTAQHGACCATKISDRCPGRKRAELSPRTFCTFRRELSSLWRTAHVGGRPAMSSRVERRKRTADDHFHADYGPSAAAL